MSSLFHNSKRLIIFLLPSILTVAILISYLRFTQSKQPLLLQTLPQSSQSVNTANDPIRIIEAITKQSIDTSNRTLQVVQWLVPIFVISLLGLATSVASSFSREIKEASKKLDEMGRKYELMSQEFEKTNKELENITNNYLNLQQDFVLVESQTLPFDLATKAFEKGKIDKEKYIESQAWYSWQKWKFGGDDTGYEELLVHKKAQKGLPKSIIRSAIAELVEVNLRIGRVGAAIDQDYDNRSRLLKILNLPEDVT